jgi:translation initiation factor 5B
MAPKGKKGKKVADDNWDEGLGESVDPIAQADADAKAADAAVDEEEETGGGGLMAALKKNKEKRKKKGKVVGNDDLDGEDQPATPTVDESLDLAAKAPEEATMDDEDVFGAPTKKGKGGKGGKQAQQQPAKDTAGDDEEGGGVKTKAQKEKEKKEREKQRKKENVRSIHEALSVLLIAG